MSRLRWFMVAGVVSGGLVLAIMVADFAINPPKIAPEPRVIGGPEHQVGDLVEITAQPDMTYTDVVLIEILRNRPLPEGAFIIFSLTPDAPPTKITIRWGVSQEMHEKDKHGTANHIDDATKEAKGRGYDVSAHIIVRSGNRVDVIIRSI